jgi:VRR-NUC domain
MSVLDATVTERDLQDQVLALARIFGWKVFYPWTSVHSAAGWPDLALVKAPRFVVAEIKTQRGRLTAAQRDWLEELEDYPGIEVFVWRPSDWPQIVEVLR